MRDHHHPHLRRHLRSDAAARRGGLLLVDEVEDNVNTATRRRQLRRRRSRHRHRRRHQRRRRELRKRRAVRGRRGEQGGGPTSRPRTSPRAMCPSRVAESPTPRRWARSSPPRRPATTWSSSTRTVGSWSSPDNGAHPIVGMIGGRGRRRCGARQRVGLPTAGETEIEGGWGLNASPTAHPVDPRTRAASSPPSTSKRFNAGPSLDDGPTRTIDRPSPGSIVGCPGVLALPGTPPSRDSRPRTTGLIPPGIWATVATSTKSAAPSARPPVHGGPIMSPTQTRPRPLQRPSGGIIPPLLLEGAGAGIGRRADVDQHVPRPGLPQTQGASLASTRPPRG